mmetsp:Transcript_3331/g.6962  ORF Transcript_3331/g.6962 Transcript_3331/m.6962 type:complete len:188 (-) Transcript_3331:227-790(-)|eukprot:CAMPEP_0168733948 /NCGR_PEP_ID=MMETSP0724-20121128/8559_1 /TAXON_ID=265536 /ORGANISM="Amphiprora sp., Strain CCMP467" /LENGTH=187 /DNA_ID=CAMNT_0008781033 /DNA_START=62 /DNA_END=625 /DNA_ORIENTATION=+
MATTLLHSLSTKFTSKIGSAILDEIPCCHGFGRKNDSTEGEQAEPPMPFKRNGKFGGKPCKYEDTKWVSLPVRVKKAARTLGYEKDSWNNKDWMEFDDWAWYDLSEEQREAASTIGWDKDSWDNKYEHHDWADLPQIVQEAAQSVGFTAEMWDEDIWPKAVRVEWEELDDKQRVALNVLGYTNQTWE